MKYSIGSTQKPVVKPFDFAAATEALSDSYIRVSDAYEELVAAEGRVAELELALDNCKSAIQSIEKFGVTATTMAVFNGENELDMALGLENLDLEAIESLGASVKKIRKENYVSGLEGKVADFWKKIVDFLKDLWAKIKRWFKELFDKNAKAVRIVNEALSRDAFKYLPQDKKAKMLSPAQATIALDAALSILSVVQSSFGKLDAAKLEAAGIKVGEGGKLEKTEKFATVFEKKEIEVKEWTAKATEIGKRFGGVAIGSEAKKFAASADKVMADAVKAAEDAAKTENATDEQKEAAKKTATERKNQATLFNQYLSVYNSLVSMVGNTMVALANMGSKNATAK